MLMDTNEKREAINTIKRGFGKTLLNIPLQCTSSIFWYEKSVNNLSSIINNGSICFVNTSNRTMAITARHVIEGYREAKEKYNNLKCQIGNVVLDPLSRIIDENHTLDIATLDISHKEIGINVHSNWPPVLPEIGKGLFFGGYPGKIKKVENNTVGWNLVSGLDIASSLHNNRLAIKLERENWVHTDLLNEPPKNLKMGGMSGGPVFTIIEDSIIYWGLSAIITEYNDKYEIFHASTINRIDSNGIIA